MQQILVEIFAYTLSVVTAKQAKNYKLIYYKRLGLIPVGRFFSHPNRSLKFPPSFAGKGSALTIKLRFRDVKEQSRLYSMQPQNQSISR